MSLMVFLFSCSWAVAACPSADLSRDCFVDYEDFTLLSGHWQSGYDANDLTEMANQWLTEGYPENPDAMVWVSINDPGVPGHEPFNGEMSKYETTNAQYCQFLNSALDNGDIIVYADYFVMEFRSPPGEIYYYLNGPGGTYDGVTNGGATRINYSGGAFTVDSGFDNHPVTYVSWYGSTAFCNYYGYRLPTEWEWQAVADFDGSYTYGCGPSINNSIANYRGSTHPDGTTVVGAFGTYGYGLCDMAGNVTEWTSSIFLEPPFWNHRFARGGGWDQLDKYCEVSYRDDAINPGTTYYSIGFRVCR